MLNLKVKKSNVNLQQAYIEGNLKAQSTNGSLQVSNTSIVQDATITSTSGTVGIDNSLIEGDLIIFLKDSEYEMVDSTVAGRDRN